MFRVHLLGDRICNMGAESDVGNSLLLIIKMPFVYYECRTNIFMWRHIYKICIHFIDLRVTSRNGKYIYSFAFCNIIH